MVLYLKGLKEDRNLRCRKREAENFRVNKRET